MAISKIPSDTKWELVSASVVVDPKFAIKELIDNAIDAGSKNVYIDIDSKTCGCDYISVRDDGTGVLQDDRNLMCLNSTTSKIQSLGDLFELSTMGFRGEALFSLATISNQKGSMEVITRTVFDNVGERWTVTQSGEVKDNKRQKVSCPKGTTVIIRKLLGGLRSRYLEVSSRALKNIEDLKNLINHYSLNSRKIRFHLSLIRLEKNGKIQEKRLQQSITPNISRVRALSMIAQLRKPTSSNFLTEENLQVNNLVKLDIILPKMDPKSDLVNVKKVRKFFSVNGRTMSLKLGLGNSFNKMITKIYRGLHLLDPTIWLVNFLCPMEIIDLNIEPAKDDVLIKDAELVLGKVTEVLTAYLSRHLGLSTYEERNDLAEKISNSVNEIDAEEFGTRNNPVNIEGTALEKIGSTKTQYEDQNISGQITNRQNHRNMDAWNEKALGKKPVVPSGNEEGTEVGSQTINQEQGNKAMQENNIAPANPLTVISTESELSHTSYHLETRDQTGQPLVCYHSNSPNSINIPCDNETETETETPFLSKHCTPGIESRFLPHGNSHKNFLRVSESKRGDQTVEDDGISNNRKMRKLTGNEESQLLALKFHPIIDAKSIKPNEKKISERSLYLKVKNKNAIRHLSMFSEYTNSYVCKLKFDTLKLIHISEQDAYEELVINTKPDNLVQIVKHVLNELDIHKAQINKTDQGWRIITE